MEIGATGSNLINSYTSDAARAATQAQDDSFARRLEEAVKNNDDKELKKACQEFEAIILNILYKQMKSTIIKSGLIEEDPGTGIFESMYDEQLMEQASKTGSFGLAESLYRQLSGRNGITRGK
ncbi:MAG: rod-binding protein [Bacillota bacterium]